MKSNRSNGFTLVELMVVIALIGILVTTVMSGGGSGGVGIYGYLNSKDVNGRLDSVNSAMPEGAIVGYNNGQSVFQASVVVRPSDGSYVTFTTEDRQWAAFMGDRAKGKCVTARIHPYAPWAFSKAETFYAGRLLSIRDCD